MAEIKITDLNLNGNDLFDDDEDFLDDMDEDTFEQVKGGIVVITVPITTYSPYCVPVPPYTPPIL